MATMAKITAKPSRKSLLMQYNWSVPPHMRMERLYASAYRLLFTGHASSAGLVDVAWFNEEQGGKCRLWERTRPSGGTELVLLLRVTPYHKAHRDLLVRCLCAEVLRSAKVALRNRRASDL